MNRKARSLGAALLAVALLVGALPTTGITAAAPSPAVGTTLLAGTPLGAGARPGGFPKRRPLGGRAVTGGALGLRGAVFWGRPPAGADPINSARANLRRAPPTRL